MVWYTLALLPGKHRTVNGREIFDTDQEIGWRAALYPISSAIKLGAFQIVCPGLLSFYHSAFKIEFLLYSPKRQKVFKSLVSNM